MEANRTKYTPEQIAGMFTKDQLVSTAMADDCYEFAKSNYTRKDKVTLAGEILWDLDWLRIESDPETHYDVVQHIKDCNEVQQ